MTLRGASEQALLIGGHIDSVPNGGWLDGCLNTLAGLEILRRINAEYDGKPPVTVRLVDWADEEGARFGKSLFGSSACSGNLDMDEARGLKDKDGISLPDALREQGIDFEQVKRCGKPTQKCRRLHRAAHRAGAGPARSRSAARRGARDFWRGAARDHFSRTGGAFRQHADEQAEGRLSRRGEDEPGDLPHRRAQRRRLHDRFLHDETGNRDQRGRGMPDHARPAASRCGGAGADAARRRERRASASRRKAT